MATYKNYASLLLILPPPPPNKASLPPPPLTCAFFRQEAILLENGVKLRQKSGAEAWFCELKI